MKNQELDDYQRRFEDSTYATSYASASSGSLVGMRLAQLDIVLGRIVSMLEVRAVARLLSQIPSGGVLLDVPCGHGKLRSVGTGRFRILGIDASRPLLLMYNDPQRVGAVLADIRLLPLRDKAAKSIVCHRFLHRAPVEQRSRILEELRRAASGYMIVYYSIPGRLQNLIITMERRLLSRDRGRIHATSRKAAAVELEVGPWRIVRKASVARWISTGCLFLVARKEST